MTVSKSKRQYTKKIKTENNSIQQEVKKEPVFIMMYHIETDHILGADEKEPGGIKLLSGLVSRFDLDHIKADFDWLMKTNQIKEYGYVPVS